LESEVEDAESNGDDNDEDEEERKCPAKTLA